MIKSSATAGTPKLDRLPPHSIEAEQGVLGCLLLAHKDCMGECVQKFARGYEVFYDLRHQTVYDVLLEMYEDDATVDLITLMQKLKNAQQLENVGGLAYLSSLPDAVPSAANLEYYMEIVLEKYLLRKLIQTCTGIIGRVFDYQGGAREFVDQAEADVHAIAQDGNIRGHRLMPELIDAAITKIEEYHHQGGKISGLTTGFADFDRLTWGLSGGDVLIIAARPSVGKSSYAMQVAVHVALERKEPVCVFSLEMTDDQLVLRMLCTESRVNLRNIRDGFMAERDFPKLTGAAGKLRSAPIYIDDTAGQHILQIRAKARRMQQLYGIKLFVIDYLQLLNSHKKHSNRQEEISYISGQIKEMARELRVPAIVLSQLNRELEKRGPDAQPRLSDLRESGSIEQDADLVGLMYVKPSQSGNTDQDFIPVGFNLAKQRNGPTDMIDLMFRKSITRFEAAAKVESEDGK